MPEQGRKASATNQSTEKALAVLELLAQAGGSMRLRDISEALSLNASTTLRFLSALQHSGYVQQERDTQRYRPTYKICRIANQISSRMELYSVTHPYLAELTEEFQEGLCVSVERDMSMTYVDVAAGNGQTLMSVQHIGNTVPMHCTGNGKLLLLNYSEQKLDQLIAQKGLPRYTEHTITTKARLMAELAAIRRQGMAFDNEECELGVRCVACPIRDYTGEIIAGISVTGPVSRITREKAAQYGVRLTQAALQISLALGYA